MNLKDRDIQLKEPISNMDEIYRLLMPKGYFFMISNSEPENR